jgi:hypothetical protein
MGIKLYIKDDLGREFSNREWANSDTKNFAGLLMEKKYLVVLENYFHPTLNHFKQIQDMGEIEENGQNEIWFEIFLFLDEVKSLKRVMANISIPFGLDIHHLERAFLDTLGFEAAPNVEWAMEYMQDGGFYEDLEDLERLLYYLLHTFAKRIHLSYA